MTETERLVQIIENGKVKEVCTCIQNLLDQGYDQERIVQECVMPALKTVGERFEKQEVFIAQMLFAARAVNIGNEYLYSKMGSPMPLGRHKVVIGTVKGDMHFIGKNMVAMSMRSLGIEVIDLGVDVAPEQFVYAAESDPDVAIVAVSALLTVTMPMMKRTVKALRESAAAKRIQIMVGGGPITADFAKAIGANYYTETAYSAAMTAKEILDRLETPVDSK